MDQVTDGPLKTGDIVAALVIRAWPTHAQVKARDQRGIIYGGGCDKLKVGEHAKIRITELNGTNGYQFTAALLHPE